MFNFGKISGFVRGLVLASMLAFVLGNIWSAPASAQITRDTKKSASSTFVGSSSREAKRLFLQAKAFHDGTNETRDLRKARIIYLKAAGLGNNDARVNLGYLYFVGEGVKQNYMKAHNWYLSAARTGSKDAQLNLALMYKNGLGVEKDLDKAAYWQKYGTIPKFDTGPNDTIKPEKPAKPGLVEGPIPASIPVVQPEKLAKINKSTVKNPARLVVEIQDQKLPRPLVKSTYTKPISAALVQNGLRPLSAQKPQVQSVNIPNTRVASNRVFTLPIWAGNVLVVVLLFLSVFASVWFALQYGTLLAGARGHAFKEAFYANHRESLRTNFLKYPQRQSFHSRIDDPWALAMCVLMVRFAQTNAKTNTRVGEQSRQILGAYKSSPLDARKCVFKFVPNIQDRIISDIYAYDCVKENAAKPIQYSQQIKARNVVKLHSGHRKDQGLRVVKVSPVKPGAE